LLLASRNKYTIPLYLFGDKSEGEKRIQIEEELEALNIDVLTYSDVLYSERKGVEQIVEKVLSKLQVTRQPMVGISGDSKKITIEPLLEYSEYFSGKDGDYYGYAGFKDLCEDFKIGFSGGGMGTIYLTNSELEIFIHGSKES